MNISDDFLKMRSLDIAGEIAREQQMVSTQQEEQQSEVDIAIRLGIYNTENEFS